MVTEQSVEHAQLKVPLHPGKQIYAGDKRQPQTLCFHQLQPVPVSDEIIRALSTHFLAQKRKAKATEEAKLCQPLRNKKTDVDVHGRVKPQRTHLSIGAIKLHSDRQSREFDPAHIVRTAETIVANGLITPLAVDVNHKLVAGYHRWAALRLLAVEPYQRPRLWAELISQPLSDALNKRLCVLRQVSAPVAINVLNIDSENDSLKAFEIEVCENVNRKSYSNSEFISIAGRLKDRFRTAPGRPKKGEVTLVSELSALLNKSERTVFRMLERNKKASKTTTSGGVTEKANDPLSRNAEEILNGLNMPMH